MRRFFPFAALLGVALVLGCQDVGTGPDGLVPQFAKGHKGKASKTSKTATIALKAGDSDYWTDPESPQTVNVASDNKRTLFLEIGGSRATKGGDLDVASFVTRIRLRPLV